MTLTELKYIVALAQECHFGKAAERCFVSQPTLSVGVKKLEDELGVAIFERSKSAVRVTPLGHKVIEQAQKVLEEASGIKAIASEGKDQLSTPLRIGTIYTIGPYLLPHMIPQLRNIAPEMPLYVEENFTHVLRQRLRIGELDAIIIALPFTEADVVTKPLYDEDFRVLMPGNHPWTKREQIPVNDLASTDLLLLGEGHCFRDQVLEACPALSKKESNKEQIHQTTIEATSLETMRHMVASGMGVTVLPQSAIGSDNHYSKDLLATRPFEQPAPGRTVALAWRASFPRLKAIDALEKAIRQCPLTPFK
ncbi:hydrogen peroxide-inducible genes activator [Parendozoicomonas haliclonae]|uniref:Hydrogen peroxide-inducible genes activator n=1 Tax=Parendozoicomonas haliclonae TaxID=1960125 RepID=A0A1X7APY4_9GAMM|nr:hydrogen peroxide-inducible genes activator [Parendozoicomonas haliclonae]SMA50305.1 Hydrogen peroxide-inducible genes activator [Parendozoicomonas haliclonae]